MDGLPFFDSMRMNYFFTLPMGSSPQYEL